MLYSTDDGIETDDLTTTDASLSAVGPTISEWVAIPAGARGPCGVNAIAYNGNGSEDPVVGYIVAHFRF
jgi:hypothetical protein